MLAKSPADIEKMFFVLISLTFLIGFVSPAPFYKIINPKSHFDLGFQHGALAKRQIQSYFQSNEEFLSLQKFLSTTGKQLSDELLEIHNNRFPELIEELRGLSAGSETPFEFVWCSNLLLEAESLSKTASYDVPQYAHCSDVVIKHGDEIIHGHNEDWSVEMKPFIYILGVFFDNIEAERASPITPSVGLNYPAALMGTSVTFNKHRILYTMNSIFPKQVRSSGLGLYFITRKNADARSKKQVLDNIATKNQLSGYNVNLVDMNERSFTNIEVYQDLTSEFNLTNGNFSHFNEYLRLEVPQEEGDVGSSELRMKAFDSQKKMENKKDMIEFLSRDELHRDFTLITYLYDSKANSACFWIEKKPNSGDPDYVFNLTSLWEDYYVKE